MKNLTPELIAKAKAAKSAEELLAIAKANGVLLSEKEAKTYYEQFNTTAPLSDDDLEAVSGGIGCGGDSDEEETSAEINLGISEEKKHSKYV
jgi:predicted ribosomally synthesized peptide with nif11-like leader